MDLAEAIRSILSVRTDDGHEVQKFRFVDFAA
jgi:hypothetical protein